MSSVALVLALLGGPLLASPFTGPLDGLEDARPPAKLSTFFHGLSPTTESGPTSRYVVVRPSPERRVRIPGAQFAMGSTAQEMQEALQLCAHETRGILCMRRDERDPFNIPDMVRAEGHVHEVTVSDFEIDATEVTVAKYRRCVATGGCAPPGFAPGDARYDDPRYPITHVTWDDAQAYCGWAGGRLPTEAEWELAARGPNNRTFPWGMVYGAHLANHGSLSDDATDARDGFAGLAPVGSFPDGATPTGLLDMAGNVSEWVFDFYDRDEQGFGYKRGKQTNPKGSQFGPYGHVIRGGSWRDGGYLMRAASRRATSWASRAIGFRCARTISG